MVMIIIILFQDQLLSSLILYSLATSTIGVCEKMRFKRYVLLPGGYLKSHFFVVLNYQYIHKNILVPPVLVILHLLAPRQERIHPFFHIGLHVSISESDSNCGIRLAIL